MWVRFDTQLPSHPKILELVDQKKWQAISVWHFSVEYCGSHGTDGFIPRLALGSIHATPRVAADLVDVRLWVADRKGWLIPDYVEYQPSNEKSSDARAAQQAGSRKGNCIRWHGPECGCWRGL